MMSARKKATTPQGAPPQAESASGIRIRMYRVGFGDFFLVSLRRDGEIKHILIDCGVFAADQNSIEHAIEHLAQETEKQLALVIMTHRHADHISGFAVGKNIFKGFTVDRVWMPWFENRKDPGALAVQRNLTAMATTLQATLAARGLDDDNPLRLMAANVTGDLSAAGRSNAVALDVLHGGFKNPAPVDYYKAGDTATLPESLVAIGLTANILGPPGPDRLDLVKMMDNSKYQYLLRDTSDTGAPPSINRVYRTNASEYPKEAFELFSEARIAKTVRAAQPDVAAALAQQADKTLNNQSLIVCFTYNGKTMLFVGDAQWGNWDNFLFDGVVVSDNTPLLSASKAILQNLDFYKVGHHGSRNATPVPAVTSMRDGVVAMCSTQPGAYGESPNTQVPQQNLLDALDKKTAHRLARSDQVALPFVSKAERPAGARGADNRAPLSPVFKADETNGYIDYEM
jgi:beta-lactamase superfamily II metal-dependent hydrolase